MFALRVVCHSVWKVPDHTFKSWSKSINMQYGSHHTAVSALTGITFACSLCHCIGCFTAADNDNVFDKSRERQSICWVWQLLPTWIHNIQRPLYYHTLAANAHKNPPAWVDSTLASLREVFHIHPDSSILQLRCRRLITSSAKGDMLFHVR